MFKPPTKLFWPPGALFFASLVSPSRFPKALGEIKKTEEKTIMANLILNSLKRLHQDEAGQGLVEYLLILALVPFAATAGMGTLASGLNSAFSAVGSKLGAYIT